MPRSAGHHQGSNPRGTARGDFVEERQVYWPGQMHDLSRGISTTPLGSGRGSKVYIKR